MAHHLYTGPKRIKTKPLQLLMALNVCFAFMVLFTWTAIAALIAEPISWATWVPIDAASQPSLLEYPYILLWGSPLAGAAFAWTSINLRNDRWAFIWVTIPIILIGMILGYYYIVPNQFH